MNEDARHKRNYYPTNPMPFLAPLRPHEQRVVVGVCEHSGTLKEIAWDLGIAYDSLKLILQHVYKKLNVGDIRELTLSYWRAKTGALYTAECLDG